MTIFLLCSVGFLSTYLPIFATEMIDSLFQELPFLEEAKKIERDDLLRKSLSGEVGLDGEIDQIVQRASSDSYLEQRLIGNSPLSLSAQGDIQEIFCDLSSGPQVFRVTRTRFVRTERVPEKKREVRRCLGHERSAKRFWKSDAKGLKSKWEEELRKDPLVKEFEVEIKKHTASRYEVVARYWHKDDCSSCDRHRKIVERIQEEKVVENLSPWAYSESRLGVLLEDPRTRILERRNLENEHSEMIVAAWVPPPSKKCPLGDFSSCSVVSKKCVLEGPLRCARWKIRLSCQRGGERGQSLDSLKQELEREVVLTGTESFEDDLQEEWEADKALSTLSLLGGSSAFVGDTRSPRLIQVFPGTKEKCSIGYLKDGTYDCCRLRGVTKDLLVQCSPEENRLRELRASGRCIRVGEYRPGASEIGVRKYQTYCCYPSKLARLFNEQARQQLGISFGSSKDPNCRGLTVEEIRSLDLSQIDLSSAFEVNNIFKENDLKKSSEELKSAILRRIEGAAGA